MELLKYSVIGALGVVTDVTVFYLALSAGGWYQLANLLGYTAGTFLSFCLNRVITFKVEDKIFMRLLLFFSVAGLGFLTGAAVLWYLVEKLSFDFMLAKILSLPVVLLIQFVLNKNITFKKP